MTLPKTLYHYCSVTAFYNIVSERKLRLSDHTTTNDSLEGKLFLRSLSKQYELHPEYKNAIDFIINNHQTLLNKPAYIGCFSEECDSLSQWRGYADDCTGFCIGFDPIKFNAKHEDVLEDATLHELGIWQVHYLDEHFRGLEDLFTPLLAFLDKQLAVNDDIEIIKARVESFNSEFSHAALAYKHASFRSEREWRLIFKPSSPHPKRLSYQSGNRSLGLGFSVSNNRIKQYLQLSFDYQTITEVWLGSKNATGVDVTKQFLIQNHFDNAEVNTSKTPYR